MKKVVLLMAVLFVALSCTPTQLENENTATEFGQEGGCSAPDTNCNGVPDCEEDQNNNGIPDCDE